MKAARLALCALLAVAMTPLADAAPKKSSTGEACTSTSTARKDGKDPATGQTFNCLWDTCTYCGTKNGVIDCSILKTEYSNPTDCRPAASIKNRGGSIMRNLPALRAAPQ